jgi:hypothetical protein
MPLETPPNPRRRWLQFSVGTLLVVMTILAIAISGPPYLTVEEGEFPEGEGPPYIGTHILMSIPGQKDHTRFYRWLEPTPRVKLAAVGFAAFIALKGIERIVVSRFSPTARRS